MCHSNFMQKAIVLQSFFNLKNQNVICNYGFAEIDYMFCAGFWGFMYGWPIYQYCFWLHYINIFLDSFLYFCERGNNFEASNDKMHHHLVQWWNSSKYYEKSVGDVLGRKY